MREASLGVVSKLFRMEKPFFNPTSSPKACPKCQTAKPKKGQTSQLCAELASKLLHIAKTPKHILKQINVLDQKGKEMIIELRGSKVTGKW